MVSKEENLIHVKLEYGEAVRAKREILSSEMKLLQLAKIIKNYHTLRLEELKTKMKLHRKIKETLGEIRKIQATVPKVKIPDILRREENDGEVKEIERKIASVKNKNSNNSIENQLREIQDKLKSLQ